ncbi:mannitol dehydrogenase family protein [Saccharopolyspora rhizosphaerae]|uniref:Mannitol dehydrogenase family protein n=1 Tax=Saccharopolyspora rhizosphaerae TaxID=2492662 RepID=A0A426JVG9_9PSEU|nr:mannitol dehydrogenase family protein [Saccharopolyspora rhizosphaerae]
MHLGLGSFHRSHQAWYTECDPEWGIAAHTFRNTALPRALTEQQGAYTLLLPGEEAKAEVVGSISRAHAGAEQERWLADLASPDVAVVTTTVTEAGYAAPVPGQDSAMQRLVTGLRERYRAGGAPLTLVPCDNLPGNGGVLRDVLRTAARDEHRFAEWLDEHVTVVSTVVDRITPAPTSADRATALAATGLRDEVPVVTEPFAEWVLAGEFPAGRPRWEQRGARFVDDVDVHQKRKLWFLNGAHTLLAHAGLARGRRTIREAVDDDVLLATVQQWWDVAAQHIAIEPGELAEYRRRLLERFAAPGIEHRLAQIACDGSQKIPARLLPVLRAERAAGRVPEPAVTVLAAWQSHLRHDDVRDPRAAELVELARSRGPTRRLLLALDQELGADDELVAAVEDALPTRPTGPSR